MFIEFENGSRIEGVDSYNPYNTTRERSELTLRNLATCYLFYEIFHDDAEGWKAQEIIRLNTLRIRTKKRRIKNKLYNRMYMLMVSK